MEIGSFGSGSKQNCFYLLHEDELWIIDLGISFRRLENSLALLNRDISHVKGVWITHDHDDHVRGVGQFAKHTTIPIYMHPKTGEFLLLSHRISPIVPLKMYAFSHFVFLPFPVVHDAVFHIGYLIKTPLGTLLYASDVGTIDKRLVAYAKRANIIAIEANYDEDMLESSWYPQTLKNRIRGGRGHLSNVQARDFLSRVISVYTRQVILLHLSENNNTKEKVKEMVIEPLLYRFPHVEFHISDRETWMVYVKEKSVI